MGKLDLYTLSLKSLSEGVMHPFDYQLDDSFFAAVGGGEIQRGVIYVSLDVLRTGSTFALDFIIEGDIVVPCDRCLEDMALEIDLDQHLVVKFGAAYDDQDAEVITITEEEGTLNVAWLLYEFIALQIPLKHTHPEGECNPEMSAKLSRLMTHLADEDDDDALLDEELSQEGESNGNQDDKPIDPRWSELKKLIDNN